MNEKNNTDQGEESNPWKDFQRIDEAEDIFRQMFKYSIIPTIIHDLDMNIINANDSAITQFGYTREELLAKSIFDLHTDDELDHSVEVRDQMKHEMKLSVETSFKRKDGSVFFAEATPCKFMIGDKPVIHVFIQDITERKQVLKRLQEFNIRLESEVKKRTEELEAKNKELESFSYSVSHDLRAPLRAISGFSEKLKSVFHLDAEGERIVNIIVKNTKKMGYLIDDLLRLSRLNNQTQTNTEINMNEMFQSVYEDLTQQIDDRKIEFKLNKLANCQADRTMMHQLVTNLISNAIKYTRGRKVATIHVGCEEKKGVWVYSVQDNGVGFDMKHYDKLFGIFERLHRVEEFEGTGIGLSIVQKVVEKHHGRVWAESMPDKGTTFYFTLNE